MQSKPTAAARGGLRNILMLCMKISDNTKADCFFDYAPHVNHYGVHVYRNGWEEGVAPEYVDLSSDITSRNIEATYEKLQKIYEEVKEKENV